MTTRARGGRRPAQGEGRFLRLAYAASATIALASVLPWITGPLGDPALRTPLPTLLAAALAALALWRWSVHARQALLIVPQVLALLCAALAVYAVFEARDLYTGAGEAWVGRIGIGLVLTLVGATALFLLCAAQWRSRRERVQGELRA